MNASLSMRLMLGISLLALAGQGSSGLCAEDRRRPVAALVLLGEWFGDAYFPLEKEIAARGWTMKRVGVDVEYRGCYKKERDVVLRSDILISDMKGFSGYDCLIIPSGPQFRKFVENPSVLRFVKDAHDAGLLVAAFCTGNMVVKAAGLVDQLEGPTLFPGKVTLVGERILLGPRGGGPPPGDGFESAPVEEICDAIERELKGTPSADPRLLIIGGFNEGVTYSDVYSTSTPGSPSKGKTDWSRGPSLPKALQGHTAVAVRDRVIVMGGLAGFDDGRRPIYSRDVFAAEIEGAHLGEWVLQKPLPHPLAYHAAVTYGDFIIVSGGQTPNNSSTVYRTSVTEGGEIGDWEAAAVLPRPMRGHASIMIKDHMFVLGGHDDKGFFADVYSASMDRSGKMGDWEHATPLPFPLVHCGVAACSGRIYVLGGQDEEDKLHHEVYSAAVTGSNLGEWRKEAPFPVPQSRMTVTVADKRMVVTGGGFGWAPPVYSAVLASAIGEDGVLGEWQEVGDLPGQRVFHAAVVCPER